MDQQITQPNGFNGIPVSGNLCENEGAEKAFRVDLVRTIVSAKIHKGSIK